MDVGQNPELVVISTVCPPYSTDCEGRPSYKELEDGTSFNIEQHLRQIPSAMQVLGRYGIPATHLFLMADTEVDLHPFLDKKLGITSEEFINRCQRSVNTIGQRVVSIYGIDTFVRSGLSPAARFLEFFGNNEWYQVYDGYRSELLKQYKEDPNGSIAHSLWKDYNERVGLVHALIGEVDERAGVAHIARQKAQYMAFGNLIRKRFGNMVLVFNHSTPNFAWINHRLSRLTEYQDRYISETPLFELDITTMPRKDNKNG